MQWDLGRLAHAPEEEEERDRRDEHASRHQRAGRSLEDRKHVQRPERRVEHEHRDQESEVADPVHDERLLAGVRVLAVLVPEPDEEVGAEPDALPADEHQQVVRREHEHQHEEDEEVEVREVPRVAPVVTHVTDAVDVDQTAHARHDQRHQQRQLIEQEGDAHVEVAGAEPRPVGDERRFVRWSSPHGGEVPERQRERPEDCERTHDRGHRLVLPPSERSEPVQRRPQKRQAEDESREDRMILAHRRISLAAC